MKAGRADAAGPQDVACCSAVAPVDEWLAVPDVWRWADAFACGQAAALYAVRWPAGPATGEQADAASDGGEFEEASESILFVVSTCFTPRRL